MRRRAFPWGGMLAVTVLVGSGIGAWLWYTTAKPETAIAADYAATTRPAADPTGGKPAVANPGVRQPPRNPTPLRLVKDEGPLAPGGGAVGAVGTTPAPTGGSPSAPSAATGAGVPRSATTQPGGSMPGATTSTQPAPGSTPSASATGTAPGTSGAAATQPGERFSSLGSRSGAFAAPEIEAAIRTYQSGKIIESRHQLNALLQRGVGGPAGEQETRALLTRIADETIFSKSRIADDPVTETYPVRAGDNLTAIGKRFAVPHNIISQINGIKNPARELREGQKLKAPRGPFHAKVIKSQYRLDLYLNDLYVRSYRIGIGKDSKTPEGAWRVRDRLQNPTYYPPESDPNKRIIAADDPNNPLGEFWIGLDGVDGPAVGKTGFGIHGTIEPESIGKAVSNGCIRMNNEDVAMVYAMLLPGKSTVTILP